MSDPLPPGALRKLLAIAAGDDADPASPLPDFASRYEIVRELGRGGMGVVYEAVDRHLGRRCAVKMIHAVFGGGDELRQRLAREALAAARLRHPHIAAIYDATPDYISMQLVAGCPVGAIHKSERRLLVQLIRDAAHAVQHAHEQGVVHRDLKPSNLLVEGAHVFVVDFGLAKETAAEASRTVSGAVMGTPAFMSPEQAQGRNSAVDARSDVYALGATLYACLTGAPPFHGSDIVGLLRRIAEEPPKSPAIERDLDLVLLKCLEKEPEQRYPSAAALAEDLDRWLRNEPVLARRPSWGYRLSKLLQRRKVLLRASLFTALGAAVLTALILVPIAWRERAERAAASEAVELSQRADITLQDAAVFLRLGDYPSAQQALEGGIARAREFLGRHEIPRVRYLLSRLLRARGQPDLALVELDRAIAADPGLREARFERGLMSAARRDLTESERQAAIADLASALGAGPALTGVDLLYGRGELFRLQGQLDRAAECLKEVLAYDVMHVAARNSLAQIALLRGEKDLARYYAVSAVDLQQGFGPIYLARERRLLPTAILGLDAALVDFAPRLADGPDNALAFAHRGLVHLRRALRLDAEGRHEDARASIESAIEDHDATLVIHSEVAGVFNNRAVCLMQAERLLAAAGDSAAAADVHARASSDLTHALALDPRLPDVHFNLGVFSQRIDLARSSFQRALDLAPLNWPHLRACAARLARSPASSRETTR